MKIIITTEEVIKCSCRLFKRFIYLFFLFSVMIRMTTTHPINNNIDLYYTPFRRTSIVIIAVDVIVINTVRDRNTKPNHGNVQQ